MADAPATASGYALACLIADMRAGAELWLELAAEAREPRADLALRLLRAGRADEARQQLEA